MQQLHGEAEEQEQPREGRSCRPMTEDTALQMEDHPYRGSALDRRARRQIRTLPSEDYYQMTYDQIVSRSWLTRACDLGLFIRISETATPLGTQPMVLMYSCVCVPKLWTQQQSARWDGYRYQAWMPMLHNRNQHLTIMRSMTGSQAVIYRMYDAMMR